MATVIDITNKIKNEEAFVKLGEKSYKVNKGKNCMIEVLALIDKMDENSTDVSAIDKALEKLLGKPAMKEINAMDLSMKAYTTVFHAVIAAAMDMSYEEAEKRFQDQ